MKATQDGPVNMALRLVIITVDRVFVICVCVYATAGYPPFLPQMPPHVGLPPELCPRELLPLSAAAAAALGSISPGASLPYASRPSLVSSCQRSSACAMRCLSVCLSR